jgi:thiaminase
VDYFKFKALRLTQIPQDDYQILKEEAASIGRLPDYVAEWMGMCDKLGITEEQIHGTERSIAELAYANYLQIEATRDDWFDSHVVMVACAYVKIRFDSVIQGLTFC